MSSFKSKVILGLVRNRHLFKGQFKAPIIDETFDVEGFREDITKSSLKMEKIPEDIEVKEVDLNGLYGEWIVPQGAREDKLLLYIHGGGFISGDCDSHRMHMVKFAKATGLKTLQFNYRLAPENPFPAAPEDCLKVYEFLLDKGYNAEDIIVGGESAGGTLTLSLLMLIKKNQLPYPKAAFSISPVTALDCHAESFVNNAKKDIAPMNSWKVWTDLYIGKSDVENHILSPQFGDPTGFPPLLVCVGSYEIHLDDATAFANKAKACGVAVQFRVWDHMVHAFPMLSPLFKEARDAHGWICDFIKENTA